MTELEIFGADDYSQKRGAAFGKEVLPFSEISEKFLKTPEKYFPVIGITRFNIFKLEGLVNFLKEIKKIQLKEKFKTFEITPLADIKSRFKDYLEYLITFSEKICARISFRISDPQLMDIISAISEKLPSFYEKELLLAAGPVFEEVFRGPVRMLVDLTTFCNTNCVYCRAHSPLYQRTLKKTFLEKELLKNFSRECREIGVEFVSVVGSGEPTAHPYLPAFLKELAQESIKVNISTNLIKLSEALLDSLLRNVSTVTISISAASTGVYEIIHPGQGWKFEAVLKNVRRLAERKKEKKDNPYLILLHCINRENFCELDKMADQAAELHANSIWFQLLHATPGMEHLILTEEQCALLPEKLEKIKKRLSLLEIDFAEYITYQLKNLKPCQGQWSDEITSKGGCLVGWNFAYLCAHSYLNFCCGLKTLDRITKEKGLKEIWYSEKYSFMRSLAKSPRNKLNIECTENRELSTKRYLWDEFCASCDNHNFNQDMLSILSRTDLEKYLLRDESPFEPVLIKEIITEGLKGGEKGDLCLLNLEEPLKLWIKFEALETIEELLFTIFLGFPAMLFSELVSPPLHKLNKGDQATLLVIIKKINIVGNFRIYVTSGKYLKQNKIIFFSKVGQEVTVNAGEKEGHQKYPFANLGKISWHFEPQHELSCLTEKRFNKKLLKSRLFFLDPENRTEKFFFSGDPVSIKFYLELPAGKESYNCQVRIYHIPTGHIQIYNLKSPLLKANPQNASLFLAICHIEKLNLNEGSFNFSLNVYSEKGEKEQLVDSIFEAGKLQVINRFDEKNNLGIISHEASWKFFGY